MTEEKNEEKKMAVVVELPQVQTRTINDSEGNEYELVTLTEAVQEILEISRELKKGITG